MGVMSRRVLPACGSLCFFCPSMRARSRQPVKRYKKLLTDIFPRSQDGEPNHRMISKLCEYASKNPMRVPKITKYLEQRCYKELRSEHVGMAKVVPCIYRKLLASCKEQMPLFATSILSIIRTLFDQSRQDDIQILGCETLVDFLNIQMDSTYMFNLEGLIPKLCQFAQEIGEGDKALRLRSAGLRALASMVHFMGEYSHISMDFDNIVSVILENYEFLEVKAENGKDVPFSHSDCRLEQQVPKLDGHDSAKRILTHYKSVNNTLDTALASDNNPVNWSRVCLHNMADLAKEATTVRRVLEPIFCYFDSRNHWSPDKGIAQYVLHDMQTLMEKSGENSHLLLSILVKHLDHKNVVKQPEVQVDIVKVTASLAQHAKLQSSIALVTAISDLMRHLRKCLQCSIEVPNLGDETKKWNSTLYCAIEDCLLQLTNKVGDIGPILDMMAVVLENIPLANAVARATLSTVYHTARIVFSLPNISYRNKAFPEALFHQLLLAMTHPDHETRVGSHRVFCTILVPSIIFPWSIPPLPLSRNAYNPQGAVLAALSGYSFPGAILEKMEQNSVTNVKNGILGPEIEKIRAEGCQFDLDAKQCTDFTVFEKEDLTSLQLSSYQVGLLLSSIWVQATSLENIPANYEAIAHTFNLALISSQVKASSHSAVVRCFQLALSLRILSLDQESSLPPSCRRSLFTTASSMLIFSAKAGGLVDMIATIKSNFTVEMDDPHLHLIEDSRLQAVYTSDDEKIAYGSNDDTASALKFLLAIETDDKLLKELVTSHLLNKLRKLSEEELLCIKEQLMQQFSPDDDTFLHGAPLFMETPRPCSPLIPKGNKSSNQIMPCASFDDEDLLPEPYGSQSDRKMSDSLNASDILNVNQLIESVIETARQVASMPVSTASVPYDQMKSQCEALVVGKQQKMSVLLSFKQQNEALQNGFLKKENEERLSDSENTMQFPETLKLPGNDVISIEHEKSFRLPPSSPYDKFMRAAGC